LKRWIAIASLLCVAGRVAAGELPFRPLTHPDDHFSASDLTMAYERDLSIFLSPNAPSYLDLDQLDRYRYAAADSSRRVWSDPDPEHVAQLTPEQKDEVTPPTAGVQVGIPSYVSVPGILIGGAALLVKVLSELF
jgi:hypothetical protein